MIIPANVKTIDAQDRQIKQSITLDHAASLVLGVGAIYQLLNKRVPVLWGVAGTALTLFAMAKTLQTARNVSRANKSTD